MEHPKRKTWTMKHPALAKAFAVVFAVMCLIMLAAGASGIGKANEDNAERLRYEKKYAERIENYAQLCERLENSITYDELWAELEKEIEQHDEDASEYKTDLAMHTAEKGGYKMGADMIWEAVPDFTNARRELAMAKQQLTQNADKIEQLKAGIEQLKMAKAGAEMGVQGCRQAKAGISSIPTGPIPDVGKGNLMLASRPESTPTPEATPEPTPTPTPEASTEPTPTPTPTPEASTEPTPTPTPEASTEPTPTPTPEATPDPTPEPTPDPTPEPTPDPTPEPTELPVSTSSMDDASLANYYKRNVRIRYASSDPIYGVLEGAYSRLTDIVVGLNELTIGMNPAAEPVTIPAFGDLPGNSPDEKKASIIGVIDGLEYNYQAIADGVASQIKDMEKMLKTYNDGVAAIKAGEDGLWQAWGQLEMIWWELGQLEDEHEGFAEIRDALDAEAAKLSKEVIEADALHELENDRTSAKLLLTSVKEVNDMVEDGAEVIPSAEKYLADYKAQTEFQHKGWMLSCILAIVGGAVGLVGIPAVYELSRRRVWLIAPVVLCLLLAGAAEAVYYAVGLGWWYVGMFTAIIALIHLVIVAPKEKKPVITE